MGGESPKATSTPTGAVFLSYASDDVEAAERIATALRSAGIEVWFDREELRGGDAWDQKIRQQIHDCRLFVPIISANTEARLEGYFRREWKLAADRTESMASEVAFLFPVVIDSTLNSSAHVPEKFRHVQWTRLADGQLAPAFVDRVRLLLSPEALSPQAATLVRRGSSRASISAAPTRRPWSARTLSWLIGVMLALTLAYIVSDKVWISRRSTPPAAPRVPAVQQTAPSSAAAPAATPFAPPPHSIAVLPFVNLSGDKEQEYFSDGLTEELLNSLSEIEGLQVAARTSSFSFREHPDIATVAHKLNVGAVLEGSVRRSGHTVRITAQLINAVSGFHLWSKAYDRDLGDVLKLQTEIASAVAAALEVTLLGDVGAKIELGGTRDPAALDAYLHASKAYQDAHTEQDLGTAIAGFTKAIHLDPGYALASAGRSLAFSSYADSSATGRAVHESFDKALADARETIRLAPELAEGHLALAEFLARGALDFREAIAEFERALALAPGNVQALSRFGRFAVYMGRTDAGIAASRRAVRLDPLNPLRHYSLGYGLFIARRYADAVVVFDEVLALDNQDRAASALRGLAYLGLRDLEKARVSCETDADEWVGQFCLVMAYDKIGRHADADGVLTRLIGSQHDARAYEYADIYAQRGETLRALEWLDTAVRLRNPRLALLKTEPFIDPLRKEPRFQAIERELKFPD
jgi:TolB-like protein